jgi:hypothetical protein
VFDSQFYKRPVLSVLLGLLRKANYTFQLRIQRLYQNVVGFAHAAILRMPIWVE